MTKRIKRIKTKKFKNLVLVSVQTELERKRGRQIKRNTKRKKDTYKENFFKEYTSIA